MIRLDEVTKRFAGVTALGGVTLRIARGEMVGFLGPNGAGKTTAMRILAAFLPPTTGSARVDGLRTTSDSLEVRRRVGYLPESVPLYRDMRVREYLAFRARLKGLRGRRERKRRVAEVGAACGLAGMERRLIGHLSKGYRQRVGLADALVHDPPVLILDEPTVGLDPSQIREIRDLIRRLAVEHTVILSTHILSEVELICDRVVILHEGRLVGDFPLGDLPPGGLEEAFLGLVGRAGEGAP